VGQERALRRRSTLSLLGSPVFYGRFRSLLPLASRNLRTAELVGAAACGGLPHQRDMRRLARSSERQHVGQRSRRGTGTFDLLVAQSRQAFVEASAIQAVQWPVLPQRAVSTGARISGDHLASVRSAGAVRPGRFTAHDARTVLSCGRNSRVPRTWFPSSHRPSASRISASFWRAARRSGHLAR